jgi:hypothetical protein
VIQNKDSYILETLRFLTDVLARIEDLRKLRVASRDG